MERINIKKYVLWCTTIGLESPIQATFNGKIGQFFVPTSQKMRLCVDVIWRHSCSYVVLPIHVYI